jgi:hypothetical protein
VEGELFNQLGYYYERSNNLQIIIKGENKLNHSEPREHKRDFDDYECDMQIIDYHSNINESCVAADSKVKSIKLNRKQRQVIESTPFSDYNTACLRSEIDPQESVDECEASLCQIISNTLSDSSSYLLNFSIDFKKNSRKSFNHINECKQTIEVSRCNEQTFEYNFNVDMPCSIADSKVKSIILNGRQRQVI